MASKLPNLPDNIDDILYVKRKNCWYRQKYCGYRREYLVRSLSEMEESFVVCKVCSGIMREAALSKGETTCLFCSDTLDKLNAVNMVQNSVAEFDIKCPILRNCEWKGKLSEAEKHLKVCDNFIIQCAKCKQIFPRKEEHHHKSEICQMRKIICKYECGKSGYAKDLEKHEKCCIKIPILCPNGCEIEFPREDSSKHRNVCELEEITCPYAEYGCKVKPVLRRELLAHKQDNLVEHTDFSLNRIKQLENEKKNVEWTMKKLDGVEWEFRFKDIPQYEQIGGPTFYIDNYKLRLWLPFLGYSVSYDQTIRFRIKRIKGEFDKQLGNAAITHYRVIIVDQQDNSKSHYAEGPMNYQLKIGVNSEIFYSIDNDTCGRYLTADNCISVRFYFDTNTHPPLRTMSKDNATNLDTAKISDIDPFS